MERIDPYTPLISGIGQNIWIHFPNGLLLNRQCFYSHQQHQGRSSGIFFSDFYEVINNRTMKHNFGLWRWWGGVSNLEVRTHGEHIESWRTGRVGTRSPQCSLRCSKSTLSCTAVWKVCLQCVRWEGSGSLFHAAASRPSLSLCRWSEYSVPPSSILCLCICVIVTLQMECRPVECCLQQCSMLERSGLLHIREGHSNTAQCAIVLLHCIIALWLSRI